MGEMLSFAALTLAVAKPNIILIMADDLGAECIGTYGGESYKTPNIDKMAAEGIRFDHCYSQPLCTPSRIKLMTGQSNIRNYSDFSILDPDLRTFGHMMKDAGYATAVMGKWQLYGAEHYGDQAGTGTHPRDAGFDGYCLWQVSKLGSRYWNPTVEQDGLMRSNLKGQYGPDVTAQYLYDFMEENRDKPFFAYWPMALPHDPFVPAPGSEGNKQKNNKVHFKSMVEYTDKLVGDVRSKVEDLGIAENTVILFVGDNGTHQTVTSRWRGIDYKGGKRDSGNQGTWVPFVVWGPGHVLPGRTTDDLVDFSDFVPTLAESAGVKPLKNDGVSFWNQLTKGTANGREAIHIYSNPRPYRASQPRAHFVRNQDWKLHRDGRLYDMTADFFEQRPIMPGEGSLEAKTARMRLMRVFRNYPAVPQRIRKEGWLISP
jgi:arylsulfatase A-like enzyme